MSCRLATTLPLSSTCGLIFCSSPGANCGNRVTSTETKQGKGRFAWTRGDESACQSGTDCVRQCLAQNAERTRTPVPVRLYKDQKRLMMFKGISKEMTFVPIRTSTTILSIQDEKFRNVNELVWCT